MGLCLEYSGRRKGFCVLCPGSFLFDLRIRPSHFLYSMTVTDGYKSSENEASDSLPRVTVSLLLTG